MKVEGRRAHLSHASAGPSADRCASACVTGKLDQIAFNQQAGALHLPALLVLVKKECASMISSESSSFQISFLENLALISSIATKTLRQLMTRKGCCNRAWRLWGNLPWVRRQGPWKYIDCRAPP